MGLPIYNHNESRSCLSGNFLCSAFLEHEDTNFYALPCNIDAAPPRILDGVVQILRTVQLKSNGQAGQVVGEASCVPPIVPTFVETNWQGEFRKGLVEALEEAINASG